MNRQESIKIIESGLTESGRSLLEIEARHNMKIHHLNDSLLESIANQWIKHFPALEAQADEQAFPKREAVGSNPA